MSEVLSERTQCKDADEALLRMLLNALRDLRFGQVTVVVQDGVVVQVDRTEKRRIRHKNSSKP